jgi:hypothetical protein
MLKLKLEVGALRVESFDTTAEGRGARGTVRGNIDLSDYGTCPPIDPLPPDYTENLAVCASAGTCAVSCNGSCNSCYSCYGTCGGSCQHTCDPSCNICNPLPHDP